MRGGGLHWLQLWSAALTVLPETAVAGALALAEGTVVKTSTTLEMMLVAAQGVVLAADSAVV